jgi:hypothetical protein
MTRLKLAPTSISFNERFCGSVQTPTRVLCVLALAVCLIGCGKKQEEPAASHAASTSDKKWDRTHAVSEYRMLQTELSLAKTDKPYLVFDFRRNQIVLKLKGAIIWSYPMQFASESSGDVKKFLARFQGDDDKLIRPLQGKYLFAAKDQTPDSILAIVSGVVKVPIDKLQRELPERFLMQWEDDIVLEVRSAVSGTPVSKLQNALVEIRHAIARPFGETSIILNIEPHSALTLYRATTPGMPTLIYPPS